MNGVANWKSRLSDRLNPIVLKELNQAVQGRTVAAILVFFLFLQLLTMSLFLLGADDFSSVQPLGASVFSFLYSFLTFITLLFVPIYVGSRLAWERSNRDTDLLYLTTIRPSSIIWGKLFAGMLITGLLFFTFLPYMAFTYFLRGVELTSILFTLVVTYLLVTLLVQLAIVFGALNINRVAKALLGLFFITFQLQFFFVILIQVSALMAMGASSAFFSRNYVLVLVPIVTGQLSLLVLLFATSVALISPPSSNRALPVRFAISGLWLLTALLFVLLGWISTSATPLLVWAYLSVVLFCIAMFVAVSERERLGLRVRASIPAGRCLRALSLPFFSGALSGLCWSTLMWLATLLALWQGLSFLSFPRGSDFKYHILVLSSLGLYTLAYALLGLVVRKRFLQERVRSGFTWVIGLLLMVLGISLPPMIGFFSRAATWHDSQDYGAWLVGNPFAVGFEKFQGHYFLAGTAAALVALVLGRSWFWEQLRLFGPAAGPPESSLASYQHDKP